MNARIAICAHSNFPNSGSHALITNVQLLKNAAQQLAAVQVRPARATRVVSV